MFRYCTRLLHHCTSPDAPPYHYVMYIVEPLKPFHTRVAALATDGRGKDKCALLPRGNRRFAAGWLVVTIRSTDQDVIG